MKVTKTQNQPAFQPIELKITIESKEEYDVLKKMVQANHTNTQAMVSDGTLSCEDAPLLAKMFANIYEAL